MATSATVQGEWDMEKYIHEGIGIVGKDGASDTRLRTSMYGGAAEEAESSLVLMARVRSGVKFAYNADGALVPTVVDDKALN